MIETLKPGDVVTLKSGGPALTVADVPPGKLGAVPTGLVAVAWFDGGTFRSQTMPAALLEPAHGRYGCGCPVRRSEKVEAFCREHHKSIRDDSALAAN